MADSQSNQSNQLVRFTFKNYGYNTKSSYKNMLFELFTLYNILQS